jgi:hypothetical protein
MWTIFIFSANRSPEHCLSEMSAKIIPAFDACEIPMTSVNENFLYSSRWFPNESAVFKRRRHQGPPLKCHPCLLPFLRSLIMMGSHSHKLFYAVAQRLSTKRMSRTNFYDTVGSSDAADPTPTYDRSKVMCLSTTHAPTRQHAGRRNPCFMSRISNRDFIAVSQSRMTFKLISL